jgi:hypothetical protein
MQTLNVKTIIPENRPNYNEWCKQFNVSRLYQSREGINNAQRIMSLWDSFSENKLKFVPKSMNEIDY